MNQYDQRIKEYLRKLDPEKLGFDEVKSITVRKLGLGESNLNYLAIINGKRFIVRINMDPSSPHKSKKEYDSLKITEQLGIAPKAFHFEPSKAYFGETFIILEYLEGRSLDKYGEVGDNIIPMLARVVAHLHNTNIENMTDYLQRHKSSKTDILNETERRITYIETKRRKYFEEKGEFMNIITNSYRKLQKLKFIEEPCYVLGHGDIAPQNAILSQGMLKLVDWEDLGLIDPALEIAIVFDQFDFSDSQKELFLKEYETMRRDSGLRKRIATYWLFQLFDAFCWAIMHVYEIGEGEMHEAFVKEQNLRGHINYAQKMFNKCKKEGIIDKNATWNPSEIFPQKYLI